MRLLKGGAIIMTDQLQEHLNKGMYGTPKLKPDEQRKYLGTFRERVDLTVTFNQLNTGNYFDAIKQELETHPEYRMTINGNVDQDQLSKLIQIANQAGAEFTCSSDLTLPHAASDLAIVIAAKKQAIHTEIVDVAQRYPNSNSEKEEKNDVLEKKHHFSLKDLFHHK